jgi:hypothetical protein
MNDLIRLDQTLAREFKEFTTTYLSFTLKISILQLCFCKEVVLIRGLKLFQQFLS